MGLIVGLIGAGGGLMTVPALHAAGLKPADATELSLLIVGLLSITGGIQGVIRKQADVGLALGIAIPSAFAASATRYWLIGTSKQSIIGPDNEAILYVIFSATVLLVGLKMLFRPDSANEGKELSNPLFYLLSAGIGFLSALIGAGGGFLMIPLLTHFKHQLMDEAIPTAQLAIGIQALVAFSAGYSDLSASVDMRFVVVFLVIAAIGLTGGVLFRPRISSQVLKQIFALLLISTSIYMGYVGVIDVVSQ